MLFCIVQVSQEAEQSDETIRVLEADSSEASDMITQENHSISNQSEDLISVALVSNGKFFSVKRQIFSYT